MVSPSRPRPPQAPRPEPARPLAGAIADSPSLASLLARVRESEARLALIAPVLPPGLASLVRAGPLDDAHWLLLAEHSSAAAKLRQCLPAIEAALAEQGIVGPAPKVKIRPRR